MNTTCKWLLLMAGIMTVAVSKSFAQYEYVSTIDYQNLTVNRVGNIPGVTYVAGNTTFDQNHQRFFFQGREAAATAPYKLYTIDAVSGAVLFNPVLSTGTYGGIQYDNATDTLYALSSQGTGATYFSWIEPATGIAHPIRILPSFQGFAMTTFDAKDHLYICQSGSTLFVIDAATGNILYNVPLTPVTEVLDLKFDNATGKLYGICFSPTLLSPQFDSISLATGTVHFISNLPKLSIPSIDVAGIDETGGKYFFVGIDPYSNGCINDYFYVLDISTGAVVSKTFYPYAPATLSILAENAIFFCFDNKKRLLYALNWHPPPPAINPYINITASANPICPGDPVTFTATPGVTEINPSYQWLVNGVNTGTNNTVYINSNLQNNDTVYCIITNHTPCAVNPTDTSNKIIIQYNTLVTVSISIAASATTICASDSVVFTATPVNGGNALSYQWQVNGNNSGTNSDTFTTHSLQNGDIVGCILTNRSNCTQDKTIPSNNIVMQVNSANASVSITTPIAVICRGDSVQFTATPVNGGNSPSYQWQINGSNVGINEAIFTASRLVDGDQVGCILTGSIPCSMASANTIRMTVNPAPVIIMENDTIITRGTSILLTPSITGIIASYQWTPVSGLDNPNAPQTIAMPATTTTYQLLVTTDKGCSTSGKRTIGVYTPLQIPTVFTPNGDGRNDLFRIPPSLTIPLLNFSVYNRWGQRVFSTTNSGSGWDGTFNGRPQPTGTYVWEIEYQDILTRKSTLAKGTVMLIR